MNSIANIDISTAGAWQRRGYASLNGLVTIIAMDTNQCVDFEVLAKTCKSCESNEKKKGTEQYETFKSQHGFAKLVIMVLPDQWRGLESSLVLNVLKSKTNYDIQLILVVTPALTPLLSKPTHILVSIS